MRPEVELPIGLIARESLMKLDGALRERRDVVIWWYKDVSTLNAKFDVSGKRSERQQSGKVPC
jgi:hypothetical protein